VNSYLEPVTYLPVQDLVQRERGYFTSSSSCKSTFDSLRRSPSPWSATASLRSRVVASRGVLHTVPCTAASFTSTASGEGLQVPAAPSALGSAGRALHQSPSGSYAQGNDSVSPSCGTQPGAMPALGFPSASLPACTPAPASQYPAGDRGLSLYTPQHITALAMIPPAAAHITAAPITPLVYPERPDFTPSHFLLDADDPDPPLEQLHYLQHAYQHHIPGTHPQLWSCLQHSIQQHQRDPDSSSPAVVTSVTSALRSARTAALQLGIDPSAVASDMHLNQPTSLPQLHVALQGPSEATGAPRSAAAMPPSGVGGACCCCPAAHMGRG
jgi:hypothetical protein